MYGQNGSVIDWCLAGITSAMPADPARFSENLPPSSRRALVPTPWLTALLSTLGMALGCSSPEEAPGDDSESAGVGGAAHAGGAGSLGGERADPVGGAAGITSTLGGRGGSSPAEGGTSGTTGGSGHSGGGGRAGATGGGDGSSALGGAGAGNSSACASPRASTATRPELTQEQSATYTAAAYLANAGTTTAPKVDPWHPTGELGSAASFVPDFTVAVDGSGSHATVQAAIDAAVGSARRYILVKPGTYREAVNVPTSAAPITLYGAADDATRVVIVDGRSAGDAGGTAQSATVTVKASDFQALNLTIRNDFATPPSGSNIQAVALYTTGDKLVLQNVRLRGFQDTLYLDSPSATSFARVYVRGSFIEGDTDFIFGRATAVFEGSTFHYLSSRKGNGSGVHFAPSTHVDNPLGFLVVGCTFTADATAPANKIYLGRSWDQSSTTPTPNGQAVIRESVFGAHIREQDPWAPAATTSRPYGAKTNRFHEYCNTRSAK